MELIIVGKVVGITINLKEKEEEIDKYDCDVDIREIKYESEETDRVSVNICNSNGRPVVKFNENLELHLTGRETRAIIKLKHKALDLKIGEEAEFVFGTNEDDTVVELKRVKLI